MYLSHVRSSHRRYSVREGLLKNFGNFTGNYLCWNILLIKLQAFSPATLLKRLQHRCFAVKCLRTPILKNICERLLLIFIRSFSYFSRIFFLIIYLIWQNFTGEKRQHKVAKILRGFDFVLL